MENQQEVLKSAMRPERLASAIAQSPKYVRDDIASLVREEQEPGSFGDLIKRSFEMTEAHKEYDGTNVVSLFNRRAR